MEKRIKSLRVSDELTLGNGNVVMRVKHGYLVEIYRAFSESIILSFESLSSLLKWLRRD